MHVDLKPLQLVTIIIDREEVKKVVHMLNDLDFALHQAFLGRGTAPTELSTILGVGEKDKAVITLVTAEENVKKLYAELESRMRFGTSEGKGIAFTISINSMSNMKVFKFITGLN